MELPSTDTSPTSPPRSPQLVVSFTAPAASRGGGLMDAVSSVAAAVGIDVSGGGGDPWQRSVTAISCESHLAPRVDWARIVLADDSQSPVFNIGDTGNIQLGYAEDRLYPVITGAIIGMRSGLQRQAALTIGNGAYRLSQLCTNQSFEQQSAGEIVEALAALAEVETGTVEFGVDLPFYVVDDGRNLYQHIALLAEKSGVLAAIGGDGKLNFKAASDAAPEQTFHYGVDIVQMHLIRSEPRAEKITVVGAGAAGGEGADAWGWLVKDRQSITAILGDGAKSLLLADPSLRSSDAVQQAAAGRLFASRQQAQRIKLTVIGAPLIRAGCKIEIADAPLADLNGTAIVRAARHHYSKHGGFTSEITALMESESNSMDSLLASALGGLGGLL